MYINYLYHIGCFLKMTLTTRQWTSAAADRPMTLLLLWLSVMQCPTWQKPLCMNCKLWASYVYTDWPHHCSQYCQWTAPCTTKTQAAGFSWLLVHFYQNIPSHKMLLFAETTIRTLSHRPETVCEEKTLPLMIKHTAVLQLSGSSNHFPWWG